MGAFLIYRATNPLVHPLHHELLHLIESNEHISCTVMYDEDGEHLPLSRNSRVTVLPTSTPWTADVIGPLLPKGCQAYICGPPAFFASTRISCRRLGWSRRTSSLSALDHRPKQDNCPAGQPPK